MLSGCASVMSLNVNQHLYVRLLIFCPFLQLDFGVLDEESGIVFSGLFW
jgi:hypothetical protein